MSSLGLAVADRRAAASSRIKNPERMLPGARFRPRRGATRSLAALRSLPDQELVSLARERNADAFEVIYDRHASAAYSLASRICGTRAMAEDVVQEAFLSLWRRLDDYDPARGELRSWLLRIVHNGAIDRLRHGRMQDGRRASDEGIEDRLEAPERTDLEVEQREQAGEVRTALDALPSEQRRVIELAYFEGLSQTQIASLLEMPVGTVKGRMRLGLTKLAAQLGPGREAASDAGRVAL
jgi:RNA polymerase sigma-70 factor (ECF subfamily)